MKPLENVGQTRGLLHPSHVRGTPHISGALGTSPHAHRTLRTRRWCGVPRLEYEGVPRPKGEHTRWTDTGGHTMKAITVEPHQPGPTGGNVRRDAIDTLGDDIHCLFSILHWQYMEKTPLKLDSTPAKCPN